MQSVLSSFGAPFACVRIDHIKFGCNLPKFSVAEKSGILALGNITTFVMNFAGERSVNLDNVDFCTDNIWTCLDFVISCD